MDLRFFPELIKALPSLLPGLGVSILTDPGSAVIHLPIVAGDCAAAPVPAVIPLSEFKLSRLCLRCEKASNAMPFGPLLTLGDEELCDGDEERLRRFLPFLQARPTTAPAPEQWGSWVSQLTHARELKYPVFANSELEAWCQAIQAEQQAYQGQLRAQARTEAARAAVLQAARRDLLDYWGGPSDAPLEEDEVLVGYQRKEAEQHVGIVPYALELSFALRCDTLAVLRVPRFVATYLAGRSSSPLQTAPAPAVAEAEAAAKLWEPGLKNPTASLLRCVQLAPSLLAA